MDSEWQNTHYSVLGGGGGGEVGLTVFSINQWYDGL